MKEYNKIIKYIKSVNPKQDMLHSAKGNRIRCKVVYTDGEYHVTYIDRKLNLTITNLIRVK